MPHRRPLLGSDITLRFHYVTFHFVPFRSILLHVLQLATFGYITFRHVARAAGPHLGSLTCHHVSSRVITCHHVSSRVITCHHVPQVLTSGLSVADFPFVRAPSASPDDVQLDSRKAKLAAANANVTATGRRLIVFVLGGVTPSEMRSMCAEHVVTRHRGQEAPCTVLRLQHHVLPTHESIVTPCHRCVSAQARVD